MSSEQDESNLSQQWLRTVPVYEECLDSFWSGKFDKTHPYTVFLSINTNIKQESMYLKQHALDVLDACLAGLFFTKSLSFWECILLTSYDLETFYSIDQHEMIIACLLLIESFQNKYPGVLPMTCFNTDQLYELIYHQSMTLYMTAATRQVLYKYPLQFLSLVKSKK